MNISNIINFGNSNPSFIINLIDRDDGNKKKQKMEKTPGISRV